MKLRTNIGVPSGGGLGGGAVKGITPTGGQRGSPLKPLCETGPASADYRNQNIVHVHIYFITIIFGGGQRPPPLWGRIASVFPRACVRVREPCFACVHHCLASCCVASKKVRRCPALPAIASPASPLFKADNMTHRTSLLPLILPHVRNCLIIKVRYFSVRKITSLARS